MFLNLWLGASSEKTDVQWQGSKSGAVSVLWEAHPLADIRAPEDHINIRISQTMLSGIPLVLGFVRCLCLCGLWAPRYVHPVRNHGAVQRPSCPYSRLQNAWNTGLDDLCWWSFFSRLWGWRTVIFELSGFYCMALSSKIFTVAHPGDPNSQYLRSLVPNTIEGSSTVRCSNQSSIISVRIYPLEDPISTAPHVRLLRACLHSNRGSCLNRNRT